MARMTEAAAAEAAIKAGIEARLAVLRQVIADAERQAAALRREADGCMVVALRAGGGIAELEALLSGFDGAGPGAGPAMKKD